MMLQIVFLLTLHMLRSVECVPVQQRNATEGPVAVSQDSWNSYKVDEWLPGFMKKKKIPIVNFVTEFPKAVDHPIECSLAKHCTVSSSIEDGADDEQVRIALVIAALTHFNDLFRMISQFFSDNFDFRDSTVNAFSDIYHEFTPMDLNSSVPPSDVAQTFFIPVWYLPEALPNDALTETVRGAINITAEKGFGYTWQDHTQYDVSEEYNNIEWSLQSASNAWVQVYHQILSHTGNISVLDFLRDGNLLRLKYAKELDESGWNDQAFKMYQRQTLSLVLQANSVLLHRASYDGMEPNDAAMDLEGTHDDSYLHIASSPVHWGKDDDGNLTRQYLQSENFTEIVDDDQVIYSQSWACFKATNSGKFSTNFVKSWSQPGYDTKSLFIKDWDGSNSVFDQHNPPCTFNLPVNNQPADIRQSGFVQALIDSCPDQTGHFLNNDQIDYRVYRAFMIASDAWATVQIATQGTDPNLQTKLSTFCDASAEQFQEWKHSIWDATVSSFEGNLVFGALIGFRGVGGEVGGAFTKIKGGFGQFKAWLLEKPPVFDHPPAQPIRRPSIELGPETLPESYRPSDAKSGSVQPSLADDSVVGKEDIPNPNPSPEDEGATLSWEDVLKKSKDYGDLLGNEEG